jgi:predicted acylesterase/phospholipase RssA
MYMRLLLLQQEHLVDSILASMALPAFVYRPFLVWNRTPGKNTWWPELLIDGGLQAFLTPVEPLADFTVKTFDHPILTMPDTCLKPSK